MSRIDESKEFVPIRIAVLTVSDTRVLEDDRSGDVLAGRIGGSGHVLRLDAGRVVEIDGTIADDINRSVIQEQVEMGVAVRMAAMRLLAHNLLAARNDQGVLA